MMTISRTKRLILISIAWLAVSAFSASSFGADVSEKAGSQKSDAQTDKERVIEGRKEQQQKRKELRDAVKSGASKEEIEKKKQQVKKGQKAIVQDKKQIRKDQLGSTKDQKEAKPDTQTSKETK
jgi:hypothetical protein